MIAFMTSYPYSCNPKDVLKCQRNADGKLLLWRCTGKRRISIFCETSTGKNNIQIQMEEGDEALLKEGTVDFYSFSYYMTNCVSTEPNLEGTGGNLIGGVKNPYLKASDWGWQIDPDGLRYTLNELYARYQIPLMVVENGLGAFDKLEEGNKVHDSYRIDYLREHIKCMEEAIEDGVDLIGYTPWGCIDWYPHLQEKWENAMVLYM